MFQRKIESRIAAHLFESAKALLITGGRQVGKTCAVRAAGERLFPNVVEINFLTQRDAGARLSKAQDGKDLFRRIQNISGQPILPGETLLFLDDIQAYRDILHLVPLLLEEGICKVILCGSSLRPTLRAMGSSAAAYLDIWEMFPLDLEEFALASGVSGTVLETLRQSFDVKNPVDAAVHQLMTEKLHQYLLIGGMPAAVSRYLETRDIQQVLSAQRAILEGYRQRITENDPSGKRFLSPIFNTIPDALSARSKRFFLRDVHKDMKFIRYRDSFRWLQDAEFTIPAYALEKPALPMQQYRKLSLFKLYLSDVGLLSALYGDVIPEQVLRGEADIHYGALQENFAAQELTAHGFSLGYFQAQAQGEMDFLVEHSGELLPILVQSGKAYNRHSAMRGLLAGHAHPISKGYVFCDGPFKRDGNTAYLPLYQIMFLQEGHAS